MNSRVLWLLLVVVLLANGSATCLYSGMGPTADATPPTSTAEGPVLRAIADQLTLPIPTKDSVDVRNVVLPMGLALALLVLLAAALLSRPSGDIASAPSRNALTEPRGGATLGRILDTPNRLLCAAGGTLLLAVISAAVNQSWLLSYGWIVQFCAGAAWAYVIGRSFDAASIRRAVPLLLAIGAVAMVLTIWHRAERGLANFTWPIGPITTTAALAATWAAIALAIVLGRLAALRRVRSRETAIAIAGAFAVLALSLYVLIETGRRAPLLGLFGAAFVAAAFLLKFHLRKRIVTFAIAATCVIGAVSAALYVRSQVHSDAKLESGSVTVRFAYWQAAAGFIADRPILGSGPGTFIADATNFFALQRAYEPHVHHGNIDPSAHNEWIQAAVELGLPGAILYAAIPLGIIILTLRRTLGRAAARRDVNAPSVPDPAVIAPLLAGITAIVVTECASITLRTPIMPIWHWTLIGLLIATTTQQRSTTSRDLKRQGVSALALAVGFVACFGVSSTEIGRACPASQPVPESDPMRIARLQADQTVFGLVDNAILASAVAHADRSREHIDAAVRLWADLYALIPGNHDLPARYADALLLSGDTATAKRVLEDSFTRFSPFNVAANMLYARSLTDDPVERLRCVQRAARFGSLSDTPKAVLFTALQHTAARDALEKEADRAREIALHKLDESARDATVEALRLNALACEQAGDLVGAIADQQLAAGFYKQLSDTDHPYRRNGDAEIDAFYALARLQYAASPANYKAALAAILEAERFAVLSIRHENVADPRPEDGFVGGEVLPTELPERLYSLWQLSAFLHVVAGEDKYLDVRVLSGLPPQQRTQAELHRQLAAMAQRAYDDLSRIPPEQRPPHYNALPEMARRFGSAQQNAG